MSITFNPDIFDELFRFKITTLLINVLNHFKHLHHYEIIHSVLFSIIQLLIATQFNWPWYYILEGIDWLFQKSHIYIIPGKNAKINYVKRIMYTLTRRYTYKANQSQREKKWTKHAEDLDVCQLRTAKKNARVCRPKQVSDKSQSANTYNPSLLICSPNFKSICSIATEGYFCENSC